MNVDGGDLGPGTGVGVGVGIWSRGVIVGRDLARDIRIDQPR